MTDEATEEINGPTTTAPPQNTVVTVQGGNLPVDVDRVWNRTQTLLGVQVPPPRVSVRPKSNGSRVQVVFFGSNFRRALGIGPPTLQAAAADLPAGSYANGNVVIFPRNGSPDAIELVLVHEFAHHAVGERPRGLGHSRFAVNEGVAVYVENAYADRYLDRIDPAGRVEHLYRRTEGGTRYWFGLYHFGYRYVDARVESPETVRQFFENRPLTTEQLIHGGTPDTHPVAPLELRVNTTGGQWEGRGGYSQMGELFVRVLLASSLPEEEAASGAAGWGGDAVATFQNPEANETGYVWAIRWDTLEEANEFGRVFRRFLGEQANWSSDAWTLNDKEIRIRQSGSDTTVILLGSREFTNSIEVSRVNSTLEVVVKEKEDFVS